MDEKLREQIGSIIGDVPDLTIATVRPDGFPQATTVSYANDGLTIYFMTAADGQKALNIARNDKVSLAIDRPYRNWDEIESLSMGARATIVSDPEEFEKAGQLLMAKFPQAEEHAPPEEIELAIVRIEPAVISLIDYRKGFGHTERVEV
ncbi:pyridoxamine 5'-phosphate oxidase family protein [Parasphingopyxis algicola]|uniref:pyridoxamine 5'-phosphate oxidase family protein n=1 Tax=Parasphingopyxis algicola TaxID=2026624 RepID=UPI0015A3C7A0|nr:pyridoxamine 5'-phosphate oxidase family protein [Parasphingopyxis algicola]QLC26484.1 pyridoxamine 5'-phosphate oxidase family protein [Parasphingopyxis algicola]